MSKTIERIWRLSETTFTASNGITINSVLPLKEAQYKEASDLIVIPFRYSTVETQEDSYRYEDITECDRTIEGVKDLLSWANSMALSLELNPEGMVFGGQVEQMSAVYTNLLMPLVYNHNSREVDRLVAEGYDQDDIALAIKEYFDSTRELVTPFEGDEEFQKVVDQELTLGDFNLVEEEEGENLRHICSNITQGLGYEVGKVERVAKTYSPSVIEQAKFYLN